MLQGFAFRRPFSSDSFVSPFCADDWFIGAHVFDEIAPKLGYEVHVAPPGHGLIRSLDALGGYGFDPRRVHPRVRQLYERTADIHVAYDGIDYDVVGRWIHNVYRTLVSSRIQQLFIPPDSMPSGPVESEVYELFRVTDTTPIREPAYHVWTRRFESGDTFYAAATWIYPRHLGSKPYFCFCMPHFGYNLSVVLRPSHFAGSGLRFSTRTPQDALAGVYLVVPRGGAYSMMRVPHFHNEIRVRVEGERLKVKHDASFLGAGYQIRYRISFTDAVSADVNDAGATSRGHSHPTILSVQSSKESVGVDAPRREHYPPTTEHSRAQASRSREERP